jgi:hypothetical protein
MKFVKFVDVKYIDKNTEEEVNTIQALFEDAPKGAMLSSQVLRARDWLTDDALAMYEAGEIVALTKAIEKSVKTLKIVIGDDGYGKLVAQ